MEHPLVSAILPVFDRAGSIARAFESVLAQTYRPVELIVVDDGSTDGTAAILERYRDRATLLRQANGGAYAARNLALRHAKGELVAFIDSDDAWLPEKLARQVPLMRPGVALVYGDIEIVAAPDDGAPRLRRTGFDEVSPCRGAVLERFAYGNFVPTCTALVRRHALDEVGGFSEESRISADYLAWFRIAQRHEFDFVGTPVALYTRHQDGISSDLGRSLAARIALFRSERERTNDPATRSILDRLLFNLGLHLALAAVRGRARTVDQPLRLAREAAAMMDLRRGLWSTAAFAANQIKLRAGRLLP
jgi:glycosyltransferase involved in cell wall biosynthesis